MRTFFASRRICLFQELHLVISKVRVETSMQFLDKIEAVAPLRPQLHPECRRRN